VKVMISHKDADDHANHDEYHEGCFKCKIQTISFDRSKVRAVPKDKK
jgi:hypothetical protein